MSLLIALVATAAVVQQPRPFGYVVGDIVTQRVLLDFKPLELPRAERVTVWFERRQPRIETDAENRRWLVVDYQIVNAPQSLTTITLPAWELESKLAIPAWPLDVGPISERDAELRPDRTAPVVATAPITREIRLWLLALGLTLVAWLAWWLHRNRRARATLPFARALRELRGAGDSTPQAWQALHRAFDETAGRVVQNETLGALFLRAPYLAARREDIEKFYAQSGARFFGGGAVTDAISVHVLCADLRRLEKAQER